MAFWASIGRRSELWIDDHRKRSPRPADMFRVEVDCGGKCKGSLWWERVDVLQGGPCRAGGGQLVTSLGQELSPSNMRWCLILTNCRKQLISLVRNHNSIYLQLKLVPEWIVKWFLWHGGAAAGETERVVIEVGCVMMLMALRCGGADVGKFQGPGGSAGPKLIRCSSSMTSGNPAYAASLSNYRLMTSPKVTSV